jgi:hypothetical protein
MASDDCGANANETWPFPGTALVTSISTQVFAVTEPMSAIVVPGAGLVFQVMPVSDQVIGLVATVGPFGVPS